MLELLLGNVMPYLIGAVVALLGIWGYGKKRAADGRRKERDRMDRADRAEAARTKDRVDEARDADHGGKSAAERLRDAGRLRD